MTRLPKSLTTVTLFSKILAVILLVFIIPLASFYAGVQYQKVATTAQLELPTTVTYTEKITSLAKTLVRDYVAKYIDPSTPPSQRLQAYTIYLPQHLVERNGELTFQITLSVKPISAQANTFWLLGSGVLQPTGWVTGKQMQVKAVKQNGIYQITFLSR